MQATYGVGGIARSTYDRIFKWLIVKCNETLIDKTMKKANFTAVLDIAGFEIFEYNGFEQISINFVNEKLQQFCVLFPKLFLSIFYLGLKNAFQFIFQHIV